MEQPLNILIGKIGIKRSVMEQTERKLYFRYDKDSGKFLNTRNDH